MGKRINIIGYGITDIGFIHLEDLGEITDICFKTISNDAINAGSITKELPCRLKIQYCEFDNSNLPYWKSDEAISAVFGSRLEEVSFCKFSNWPKIMLAGSGDYSVDVDSNIYVNFHHNIVSDFERRVPQARYGKFHFWNNYIKNWSFAGNPWGIFDKNSKARQSFLAICQDGELLFENNIVDQDHSKYAGFPLNYFDNQFQQRRWFGSTIGVLALGHAVVNSRNNRVNKDYVHFDNCGRISFTPDYQGHKMYDVTNPAEAAALKNLLVSKCGPRVC